MVIAGWLEPRQGMMTAVDRGRHRSIAEIGPSKSLRCSWEWQAAASEIQPRFGILVQRNAKSLINASLK